MFKILLTIIIAGLIAELIKFLVRGAKLKYLFGTGGVVSSHAAFTWSLAAIIGLAEGFGTAVFAIALVFATVVSRDSFGLRRDVDKLSTLTGKSKKMHTVGHTMMQTFLGFILGIGVAVAMYFLIF